MLVTQKNNQVPREPIHLGLGFRQCMVLQILELSPPFARLKYNAGAGQLKRHLYQSI